MTAIIVPCYNESASILGVIGRLKECCPDAAVIVVNDCSSDDSAQKVAADGRAVLLNMPINSGIGATVQTGLQYAAVHGYDYAVKCDGDGQHPAEKIGDLLSLLLTDEADMVIGSRFLEHGGSKSTYCRRFGIGFFGILNSLITRCRISDNTSGFRAYNRRALEFLARYYPSFDYPEPEEVILMWRNGFRIREISTPMRDRQGGVSSINFHHSIYYMIKVSFSIIIAAVRPKV